MTAPSTLHGLTAAAFHAQHIEVYRQPIDNPVNPQGVFWTCALCRETSVPYTGLDLAEQSAVRHAVEASR